MAEYFRAQAFAMRSVPAPLPVDPVPGMAYVPFQQWGNIYEPAERALEAGTLFPALDKPFCGRKGESR